MAVLQTFFPIILFNAVALLYNSKVSHQGKNPEAENGRVHFPFGAPPLSCPPNLYCIQTHILWRDFP